MIHLSVDNFRALRGHREFDFPAGITAIMGRNESGKSSTVLAIAWCLFGTDALPKDISSSRLVTVGAKECRVELRFPLGDEEWVVWRTQKANGIGDAQVLRNGELEANGRPYAEGREPVTKACGDLLGVDRDGFLISVFARQDELDALAGKGAPERVSTMLRLLGIEQVNGGIRRLKDQLRDERRALEVLRAGSPDLDALRKERDSIRAAIGESDATLSAQQGNVRAAEARVHELWLKQQEIRPLRQARDDWLHRLRDAEGLVRSLEARPPSTVTVPDKPDEPTYKEVPQVDEAELADAKEAVALLREKYAVCQQRHRSLGQDTCPTCQRPFDNHDDLVRQREECERELEGLRGQGEAARTRLTTLEELSFAALKIERENREANALYDLAMARYQDALRRQEQYAEESARHEEQLAEARHKVEQAKGDEPPDPTNDAQELEQYLYDAQQEYATAKSTLSEVSARRDAAQANLARVESAIGAAEEKAGVVAEAEKRVLTLDATVAEMGKMKERLIGQIIPTLQERASAIVSDLTDGKHSELALTADYEIQWRTEKGDLWPLGTLSGGAQRVFALALRLAIAELRAGSVPLLVLDEVFESLDQERAGLAWEAIERLSKRYPTIVVITHVDGLRERAPNIVAL